MVAVLGRGVAAILMGAAEAGGETIGTELSTLARLALGESVGEEPGQSQITIPVSSEAIRAIGYHAAGIITVDFHRGGSYDYPGTEDMFIAFLAAPSKGRWFSEHLR